MKKYLAAFTMACALFGTTTLSAASYWETILEYLPDWRDFVPGMARPQIEQVQVAKATPKKEPAPKPVVKAQPKAEAKPVAKAQPKPAPKPVVKAQPKPAAKPVAKAQPMPVAKAAEKPASASKAAEPKVEPKPVRMSARQRKKAKLRERLAAKKAVISKPVSAPIEHSSNVAPPEMVLAINFEKGMLALAETIAKAPFVEKGKYNKNAITGFVSSMNAIAKQAKSKPFNLAMLKIGKLQNHLFPKLPVYLNDLQRKKIIMKQHEVFCLIRKNVESLGEISKNFEADVMKNAFKAILIENQTVLKGRNINPERIYGQMCAMNALISNSGHPLAIKVQKFLVHAENFKAKRIDNKAFATNVETMLNSL